MKASWRSTAYILALGLAILFRPDEAMAQSITYGDVNAVATPVAVVNTGNGGTGGLGQSVCGTCAGGSFQWVAARFTVTQTVALESVQGWFGALTGAGKVNVVIHTDNSSFQFPLPGTAIWSQSYQNVGVGHNTPSFVTFANYNPILAPGTYWLSFEPPSGSSFNMGMDGPAANPLPQSSYAFYNALNSNWLNFADTGGTNFPSITISALTLTTSTGSGVISFGTAARTVTQGLVFDQFPFFQSPPPIGDNGQARTLQWNIYSPGAESAAYGAITANPSLQGNVVTAGAYSASGTNASGAARGVAYATYVNTSGVDISNVQVNGWLNGTIAFTPGTSFPVQVAAGVYVFDTEQFTNALNTAVSNGQTPAQFLLGGSALIPGLGATILPNLATLFPSGSLVDSSNISDWPLVCSTNCVNPNAVQTDGFFLPKNAMFTVLFDVSAASSGAGSSQGEGIGNFLNTLEADPSQGLFTDGAGNPIAGISGPLSVPLAPTPANITLGPRNSSNAVGSRATLTATVTDSNGDPVPNVIVNFAITVGPHSGFTAPVGTDSNGNAILGFTDMLGTAGTDSVNASIGTLPLAVAFMAWTTPGPLYALTVSPQGASVAAGSGQAYTATGADVFGNSLGDVTSQVTFSIAPDGSCVLAICTPTASGPHTVTATGSNPVTGNVTGTAPLTVTGGQTTPTVSISNLPATATVGENFTAAYAYTGDGTTSVTSSTPTCTVAGNVVSFVGAGLCTLTAHSTATANYAAATGSAQSFTIGQATTTVSISNIPATATVGGNFTAVYAYTGDGTTSVTSSTPTCTVAGNVVTFAGAGLCTLTAHATAGTNYAAATGTAQSFTIGQATTTVSVSNIPASAKFGGSFTATYAYTGDGTTSVTSSTPACTVAGNVVTFAGVGLCTLTAHATAGTNYAAATGTAQSFTIGQATTTVSISNIPATATVGGSFTAAYAYIGDGTTSVTSSTATCTVAGNLVTFASAGLCTVTAHATAGTNYAAATGTAQSFTINSAGGKTNPVIAWPTPTPITYGTPLSSAQLDATANVAGAFVYNPGAKTVLTAGAHTLSVTFTPTNTSAYNTVTATVTLQVNTANPPVLWIPVPITYGTQLGDLQLDALTAVPGKFVYTPAAGTILHPGNQTLSATFTPKDTADFNSITIHATLIVVKAVPNVKWAQPAAITVGTALSTTQLNATANVPGTFVYNPQAGTVLPVGTATLNVTFTPADTQDYQSASARVSLTVKSKR